MSRQRSTINNRKTHLGVALTSVLIFGVSLSLGFTSPPRSHVALKVSKMKATKTAMEPISLESHAIDDILALADYHPQNGASPLEKNICEEQREFELKLGKALDTLRKDYPKILTEDPDYSIYHEHIEVIDPSGVKLHHLKNYKGFFSLLHTVVNLFYCIEQSGLTFRLSYDWARKNIRVSWNASLTPRAIMGGIKNQLHVDGISVYEINRESGLLTEHRVEQLLVNNAPVLEPQGIFVTVRNLATEGPESIPVLSSNNRNTVFEFRAPIGFGSRQSSLLFSQSDDSESHPLFDRKNFDAKNQSRKKFGLKPLSPSEFVEIETKVAEMEKLQRAKAASWTAAETANRRPKKEKSPLSKIFGNIFDDTCESNFDCQRPEVCCDLGFKKMCCSSGQKIVDGLRGVQPQMAPVPVVAGRYPRGGPDGMTDSQ